MHVVLLALAFEARHLPAAEQRLERAADGLHVDADVGRLVAVDVHRELRLVQAQVGVRVGEAGVCARLGEQLVRHALQLPRRTCACTTNCTGGLRKLCPSEGGLIGKASTPGRVANILARSCGGDLLRLAGALVPGLQSWLKRDAEVHRVRALQARRHHREVGADLRHLAGTCCSTLPHVVVGVVHRRRLRARA